MRAIAGSVSLSLGGSLFLCTIVSTFRPGIPIWLSVSIGCLTIIFFLVGFLSLRDATAVRHQRWLVVVPCLGAGVLGFVLCLFTSNIGISGGHEIEGGTAGYKLKIRVFGMVLHEDTSPAAERTDPRIGKFTGPSAALDLKMQLCGFGVGLAYVTLASLIGAFLGIVMCRLTNRSTGAAVERGI